MNNRAVSGQKAPGFLSASEGAEVSTLGPSQGSASLAASQRGAVPGVGGARPCPSLGSPTGCCGNATPPAGGAPPSLLGPAAEKGLPAFFLFLLKKSDRASSFKGFQNFLAPSGPKSKS